MATEPISILPGDVRAKLLERVSSVQPLSDRELVARIRNGVALGPKTARRILETEAELDLVRADRVTMLRLIADLADAGDCELDNDGKCWEHAYLPQQSGKPCPHAEAKRLLAKVPAEMLSDEGAEK